MLTGIGEGVNPNRIVLDQVADIANAFRQTPGQVGHGKALKVPNDLVIALPLRTLFKGGLIDGPRALVG